MPLDMAGRKRLYTHATQRQTPHLPCPFVQSLLPGSECWKAGGVCSIRKYGRAEEGQITASPSEIVTVCPSRFLGNADLLRWAGEVLLGTQHPIVVKEVPFLAKLGQAEAESDASGQEPAKRAGRIDWVLVHPDMDSALRWCAVETQAVYFSGKKMSSEFENWKNAGAGVAPFPVESRRPDYRSSGPKRLAPQLRVKVPELRNWGAKTCVLVDRFFYGQMDKLPSAQGTGLDQLANAEVVWLIADHGADGQLVRGEVKFALLDDSIKALNATQSIGKSAFEASLRATIADSRKSGKKVFKL